jgi:hypothetical protein
MLTLNAIVANATGAARFGRATAEITFAPTSPSLIAAERRTIVDEVVSEEAAIGDARA